MIQRRYSGCHLGRSRFFPAPSGRRQYHSQLSDAPALRQYRILLFYQSAGRLYHVQGRRRPGPPQSERGLSAQIPDQAPKIRCLAAKSNRFLTKWNFSRIFAFRACLVQTSVLQYIMLSHYYSKVIMQESIYDVQHLLCKE